MEKRRSRRKRFRVPIKYGIKTLEHNGFTTDISPHGIAIKTNRPYRPGTKVLICIEFEGEILLARGDVKWARQVPLSLVKHTKCGMEIKFTSFNKRFLTLLKNGMMRLNLNRKVPRKTLRSTYPIPGKKGEQPCQENY